MPSARATLREGVGVGARGPTARVGWAHEGAAPAVMLSCGEARERCCAWQAGPRMYRGRGRRPRRRPAPSALVGLLGRGHAIAQGAVQQAAQPPGVQSQPGQDAQGLSSAEAAAPAGQEGARGQLPGQRTPGLRAAGERRYRGRLGQAAGRAAFRCARTPQHACMHAEAGPHQPYLSGPARATRRGRQRAADAAQRQRGQACAQQRRPGEQQRKGGGPWQVRHREAFLDGRGALDDAGGGQQQVADIGGDASGGDAAGRSRSQCRSATPHCGVSTVVCGDCV